MLKKLFFFVRIVFLCFLTAACASQGIPKTGSTSRAGPDIEIFPQLGHNDGAWVVVASPDGRRVFSGSLDGTIKIWDLESQREIRTISTHGKVFSLACTTDGKQLISGHEDGVISIWDAQDGKELKRIKGKHTARVSSLVCDPIGGNIYSASIDGTVQSWNLQSGKTSWTFSTEDLDDPLFPYFIDDTIGDYAFSALSCRSDGKQLAAGSYSGDIKIIDTETGEETTTLENPLYDQIIYSLSYSPNGERVVASSYKRDQGDSTFIRVWDIATSSEVPSLHLGMEGYGAITGLSYSPDGERIVAAAYGFAIRAWDAEDGRLLWEKDQYLAYLQTVGFVPSGDTIIVGCLDGRIAILDAATGEEKGILQGGAEKFDSLVYRPDGNYIFSATREISMWDLTEGRMVKTFTGHTSGVTHLACSADGNYLVSSSSEETIAWDIKIGVMLGSIEATGFPRFSPDRLRYSSMANARIEHVDSVASLAFSPSGEYIASGLNNGYLELSDRSMADPVYYALHSTMIRGLTFSPDGKYLAAASDDGVITILNIEDIKNAYVYKVFPIPVTTQYKLRSRIYRMDPPDNTAFVIWSIAFSPDGNYLISGSEDGIIRKYDIYSGRKVNEIKSHIRDVTSLAYSPDGKYIISGSGDMTVKIWNAETLKLRHSFDVEDYVVSVAWNPQKPWQAASGSIGGGIRLWDIENRKEIARCINFPNDEWICITPDGYFNASPNGDQYLNIRINNEVYGIDQFAASLYRSSIVKDYLQRTSGPSNSSRNGLKNIIRPPEITIQNIRNGDKIAGKSMDLSVAVTNIQMPIDRVEIIVNGSLAADFGQADIERISPPTNDGHLQFSSGLRLEPGVNSVEVIVSNEFVEGRKSIVVDCTEEAADRLPNLYVFAIGINTYDNIAGTKLDNLNYAVNDANDFVETFAKNQSDRYNEVFTRTLTDKDTPSQKRILNDLESFFENVGQNDISILFISGHGVSEDGKFHLLPADAKWTPSGIPDFSTAISIEAFALAMHKPGKKFIFIDACRSGGVDSDKLTRSLKNRSTTIFTASQSSESSYEPASVEKERNGYFTGSIIEGITQHTSSGKTVTVEQLGQYVHGEVIRKLERFEGLSQHPYSFIPPGHAKFILAQGASL
jgi:WD40 repeat protein